MVILVLANNMHLILSIVLVEKCKSHTYHDYTNKHQNHLKKLKNLSKQTLISNQDPKYFLIIPYLLKKIAKLNITRLTKTIRKTHLHSYKSYLSFLWPKDISINDIRRYDDTISFTNYFQFYDVINSYKFRIIYDFTKPVIWLG